MKPIYFVYLMVFVCLFGVPLSVSADQCDDMTDIASATFYKAKAAMDQGDYGSAVNLFKKAGGYYQKASRMNNCECPLIEGSASNNVELCRNYVTHLQELMANNFDVDSFNTGVAKFNDGNNYARGGQWDLAVSSFDEAEMIWRGIDPSSNAGRKAQQMADQAHQLSEKARKNL